MVENGGENLHCAVPAFAAFYFISKNLLFIYQFNYKSDQSYKKNVPLSSNIKSLRIFIINFKKLGIIEVSDGPKSAGRSPRSPLTAN